MAQLHESYFKIKLKTLIPNLSKCSTQSFHYGLYVMVTQESDFQYQLSLHIDPFALIVELFANVNGFSSTSKSFIFSCSIAVIQSIKLFYCISYSSLYTNRSALRFCTSSQQRPEFLYKKTTFVRQHLIDENLHILTKIKTQLSGNSDQVMD